MCLIIFSWRTHPEYKLILVANRDEFYERNTDKADYWKDYPDILAGRDLKAGGTWMGITKKGRFSAITNYRDFRNIKKNAPSRGELTAGFLKGTLSVEDYIQKLKANAHLYNGFNLILGDKDNLYYFSNQNMELTNLKPGIHGLSNHLLNTRWPKVEKGKEKMRRVLKSDLFSSADLIDSFYNVDMAPDHLLPDTGIGLDLERNLSPMFILMDQYGTRCTTVIAIDKNDQVLFQERSFNKGKKLEPDQIYQFKIEPEIK